MSVKLAEDSPAVFKPIQVDLNTYNRLKTLSGSIPTAQYLRELTVELSADSPPSLDDLAGGYSMTPVKKKLDDLNKKLDWLMANFNVLLTKKYRVN